MKTSSKISGSINLILGKVLVNRIQKKAKNVTNEAMSLTLTLFVLSGNKLTACGYGINDENGNLNDDAINGEGGNQFTTFFTTLQECYILENDEYQFYMLLYILGYCTFVGVCCVLHGILFVKGLETNDEIEEAYEKTNKYPIIDILFEIPLTWRNSKYFTIFVWLHFIVIVNLAIMEFLSIGVSGNNFVTAMVIFSGYRMTGELCEYRIHAMKTSNANDIDEEEESSSYALEMSPPGSSSLLS